MAASLFGPTARSSSKNLLEFRAGKMNLKGTTVTADKRKGQVYIHQSEDSLMHFCWKDRTSGKVEDDLIIFPDDIEYKRVKQCTTGRVYILKFKSSSRKFFFWMQEPKTDKDEEYCTKVNSLLNNPPTPGSTSSGGGGLSSGLAAALEEQLGGMGESQLQGLLGNMDQQQLLQLLSGFGGMPSGNSSAPPPMASPTPTRVQSSPGPRTSSSAAETPNIRPATAVPNAPPPATPPPRQVVQLSDLQNILSNIQATPDQGQQQESVDLSRVLTPEAIGPLLNNPEFREGLAPFLPSGSELPPVSSEVSSTLWSPQFQQAVGMFSTALQSGQLGPLMSQFGFGEDVVMAAAQGDMDQFVQALQASSRPTTAGSTSAESSRAPSAAEEKPKKDDDEDEHMSLD
ncbi:proteasomal ubiquitin receptor ADRM1 [Nematostella vectensis]|uniref:proteasomal ubiquitin receptor ADRM1 n=1 Tax=Nematostella vectensis TaxID=45351 RepID=UPI0013903286|nr:proteasomal ubiquitin receptor ADRM1 [Nematostella vectensis]